MRWLFAFTLFSLTSAHSWLDCTNWIPNNQANPGFSNSQGTCAGWARRFEINPDKGFGKHDEIQFFRMFDQRGAGMAPCRNQPSTAAGGSHEIRGTPVESMYSPNKNQYGQTYYPIGTVQAGQRVCWRWPAKNHVPHAQIPNDIEVNFANRPNYEPATQAEWSSMKIATANFKDSCPTPFDVLPGNDQTGVGSERRACGTCFTVPANFVAGTYSIQWRWIASATAIYTSCGDVRVTAQPPPPPPPPAQAQESLTFVSAPTTMDARATSTLRLRYNTPVARQLVVDLLRDNTYQWYGKSAVAVPAGSGDINLQFKPQIMPPNGGGLFFSAFLTTTQAWATNQGEAWKSATRYARSNIQITGSLVPAGADADVKEKIALMLDGVPSVIATAATSFDVGVALTTTGARSIMIELASSDKKTSYASVKFPVRQGVSSNLMLPIPITKSLPVIYDNTSSIISDGVGLTLFVHLYNGNQLLSSDNKTITATGTTTLYPVEEKIAFVTDANGAIHSTFKAGSSVEILVSYAAAASRTIWLRLIDSTTGTTAVESSADVQGGRGSVRLSWQLPTTLTLNSRYQLQARLIDSMIFRVNKAAIENDMGVATTIDITIGTASQTRVITPENAGNSTIIENAASAPSTYDEVIGSSSTSDASTITMSFFTILLISFFAIQW